MQTYILMYMHSFATSNGSIMVAAGGVKTLMDVARFGDRHIQVSLRFQTACACCVRASGEAARNCVLMHTLARAHTHTYSHTHLHTLSLTPTPTHTHLHIHTRARAHTHTHTHTDSNEFVSAESGAERRQRYYPLRHSHRGTFLGNGHLRGTRAQR
jgi:hypothetical protein